MLFVFTSGLLRAESTTELRDQLRLAVRAEIQAALRDKAPTAPEHSRQLQVMLVEFSQAEGQAEGSPRSDNLLRTVEIIQSAATSQAVVELCGRLHKQLRIEQAQRDTALIQEMQEGLAAALRAALATNSVEGLDAPAQAISRLAGKAEATASRNSQILALAQQAQKLEDYLHRYQSFSVGLETGESLEPLWREFMNSSDGFSAIIPRSEILAQTRKGRRRTWTSEEQEDRAREIMSHVHSLDDVDRAFADLQKLCEVHLQGKFSDYLQYARATLRGYHIVLHDLDVGVFVDRHLREIAVNEIVSSDDTLSELRTQLLLRAIPRLLGLEQTLPPEPDDNAATYLHRVAITARSKADWGLFARAIAFTEELNIDPTATSRDRAAADLLLAGLNQERAHEYAAAVCSYEVTLKTGSQLLPAEFIGARLEDLRAAHPQDYERGCAIARATSPPKLFIVNAHGSTLQEGGGCLIDLTLPMGDITVPATSGGIVRITTDKAAN